MTDTDPNTDPNTGTTTTTTTQEEEERPRQHVERLPDDSFDVGPKFPSGMNAVEAARAGATANLNDEQIAALEGGAAPVEESGTE